MHLTLRNKDWWIFCTIVSYFVWHTAITAVCDECVSAFFLFWSIVSFLFTLSPWSVSTLFVTCKYFITLSPVAFQTTSLDSKAALNCVVPRPGNNHWQPQGDLSTVGQKLSHYFRTILARCLRRRVGGLSAVSEIAYRSLGGSNAAGTAADDGCTPDTREDRGRLSEITYVPSGSHT